MLTRGQLNTYLETYDRSMSLRRLLNLTPWITKLRDFVQGLNDDAPIDALKLVELQDIVNTRAPDTVTFRGELPADVALAKNINDALHGKTLTSFNADGSAEEAFAEHVFMMVFEDMRPEQRAQLMTMNKRYKALLSDASFWKEAVQQHFKWAFNDKKSLLNVNWLQVFGESHRNEYRHLNRREKQLFSLIKSSDFTELKMLNLKFSDLSLKNNLLIPRSPCGYVSSEHQAFLNKIFDRLVTPFYKKNEKNVDGLMLNHWAAICNQPQAILLDANLVNARDKSGATPLHLAARQGHLAVVLALIKANAKVNAVFTRKTTSLYLAVESGHLAVVEALLEAGAHPNIARDSSPHGDGDEVETPLFLAAKQGDLAIVEALIKARDIYIDAGRYPSSKTPLFIAAQQGHAEVVRVLMAAGANSNVEVALSTSFNSSSYYSTPIEIAIKHGHLAVVETFIAGGCNIEASLLCAASYGNVEIIRVLIAAGANLDAAYATGDKPLTIARCNGHSGAARLIAQAKLDLYIKEKSESTIVSKNAMTIFGKTIHYGPSVEEELNAAIALKAADQGADKSILQEHHRVFRGGELASIYRGLMR